jgi:hypothetical protein
MIDAQHLASADPLGIGGLLVDAFRLGQLELKGAGRFDLIEPILDAAIAGIAHYLRQPDLRFPAAHRLGFRELGLAIGLAALERDEWQRAPAAVPTRIAACSRYTPLRDERAITCTSAFCLRSSARSWDPPRRCCYR